MLDSIADFKKAFFVCYGTANNMTQRLKMSVSPSFHGEMYCPKCGENRRMSVNCLYPKPNNSAVEQLILNDPNLNGTKHNKPDLSDYIHKFSYLLFPSLWEYKCLQCSTSFTTVFYQGANGESMAVLPSCDGGISTPHTPRGVSYYLDQASKANSVGAYSAAVAMYRAALDNLLFEQGYEKGMLGSKIQQLCSDIEQGTGPEWALELEVEFLMVIKDLGNSSIHPNDGDIDTQAHLDSELVSKIMDTFQLLLFLIYEVETEKANRLNSLRLKANLIKK